MLVLRNKASAAVVAYGPKISTGDIACRLEAMGSFLEIIEWDGEVPKTTEKLIIIDNYARECEPDILVFEHSCLSHGEYEEIDRCMNHSLSPHFFIQVPEERKLFDPYEGLL